MKRFHNTALATTLLIGLCSVSAQAAPLDEKAIPASAKWVMHIDVDAITKTEAWSMLEPKLQARPQYAKQKNEIERLFRIKLPADLHDVTLFGASATKQDAVVLIRANMNQPDLKDLLSRVASFEEQTLEGHTVFTWDDKGQPRSGSFIGTDRLIIAESTQNVVDALNVVGGKKEGLRSSALLAGSKRQPTTGVLLYVAGDQLSTLAAQAGAKNPVVNQLDSAWIAIGADDKGLVLTSEVMAQKDEVATNAAKSIEGFKAMMTFSNPEDDRAALISEAVAPLTAKAEGKRVTITWPVSNEQVEAILDEVSDAPVKKPAK